MKKALFFLLIFFSIAYGDNSQRISELNFEIKSLEDQKPILFKVIESCQPELSPIKNSLKDVKEYRKKMDATIDKNIVNTVISGGINAGFEIIGGLNGGKFVELGAWIVGKSIGVAMEKTSPFGGVAHYKQKIDNVSEAYKNLTPELEKLSRVSKASDEAMRSYYNKYGKYSNLLELGDTGIFTTKMRLIVEQADVTIIALEALHLKLFQTLDEAERDLRNLERQIQILRDELEKLKNEDKEKKEEEPKKKELSDADKKAGDLPEVKPTIRIPDMPQGCYEVYKSQDDHNNINRALSEIETKIIDQNTIITELTRIILNEQTEYLASVKAKREEIEKEYSKKEYFQYNLDGDAHEKVKKGIYPTGVPFSEFLRDTDNFVKMLIKKLVQYNESLKKLTEDMLVELPTSHDQEFAVALTNRSALVYQYGQITSECYKAPRQPSIPITGGGTSGVPATLKSLKYTYLQELDKSEKLAADYPQWQQDRMSTLRSYFSKRRDEMKEEISQYENALSRQDGYRESIISAIQKLHTSYKSSAFTLVNNNGNYNYHVAFQTKMQESVCKTIQALRAEVNSGAISSVITQEKNIKNLLSMEKLYPTVPFPKDAYIEYGANIKALQEKRDASNSRYSSITMQYHATHSNAQQIEEGMLNNKLYQLGLLYPNTIFQAISDKQMKELSGITNLIKNFKVEISGALESAKITEDAHNHFKGYLKSIQSTFKENFSCLPLDSQMGAGLIEEIEALEDLIDKLKSKPTYMDAKELLQAASALLNQIKNFGIDLDSPENFLKEYQRMLDEHSRLHELTNKTYASALFEIDKKKINEILLQIEPYFSALDEHKKSLAQGSGDMHIENLYRQFAQYYSAKNLSGMMSLLSDEWMSSSDGTTLMDLEDTLSNSFSIFNEIKCEIGTLYINPMGNNKYSVSYTITIEGINYENDIRHLEKSAVTEEVGLVGEKAKILKTLNGKFWKGN